MASGNQTPPNQTPPQNPWGKPPAGQQKGPPEIEQLFKRFFGKGAPAPKSEKPPEAAAPKKTNVWIAIPVVVAVLIVLWAFSGIYSLTSSQQAVVLRLGKVDNTQSVVGQHWFPRFIDQVYVVNTKPADPLILNQVLLTHEGDLVNVELAVTYQVDDAPTFLFAQNDPLSALQTMVSATAQQVVGNTAANTLLSSGNAAVEASIVNGVQTLLQQDPLGISVAQVKLTSVTLPQTTQEAYKQVTAAQTAVNTQLTQAKVYAAGVVPTAAAKTDAMVQAANAYQQQVVLAAQVNIAQFQALLPVYQQYPAVTKTRLYYDAMEQVLHNSRVIVTDGGDKGNNNYYLPLGNALVPAATSASVPVTSTAQSATANSAQAVPTLSFNDKEVAQQVKYVRWAEAQQ